MLFSLRQQPQFWRLGSPICSTAFNSNSPVGPGGEINIISSNYFPVQVSRRTGYRIRTNCRDDATNRIRCVCVFNPSSARASCDELIKAEKKKDKKDWFQAEGGASAQQPTCSNGDSGHRVPLPSACLRFRPSSPSENENLFASS